MAMAHSSTQEIFDFITGDFEDAWNAMAMVPTATTAPWRLTHRCNYLFGMNAMVFLEWTCRLCKSDPTGQALSDFSNELNAVEPRYFTQIPGQCWNARFNLPSVGNLPGNTLLLSMIFDLLRNGLVHRYEQIIVPLQGGDLAIALLGAEPSQWLRTISYRASHLSYLVSNADIVIRVHPGVLFLDLKEAFERANLAGAARNLTPEVFQRGGANKADFQFTATQLEHALTSAGHSVTP
jgi:hypothetical protein